jgi:hypothetical protein
VTNNSAPSYIRAGHTWAPATSSRNKGCRLPSPLGVISDATRCTTQPSFSTGAAGAGFSYGHGFVDTPHKEAGAYRWIVGNITQHPEVSVSVYTQTTGARS